MRPAKHLSVYQGTLMATIKTIKANCEKLYIAIVWIRDEGVCQWCGGSDCLQVHHIILRNRSAYLFYDLLNLVLLCKKCHHRYHMDPQAGDRWFIVTFPARWEYLHFPICDELGQKMPRRNIIKRSWKKEDYEKIEHNLKEKLGSME